ncbi:hypothetical protein Dvina_31100 [Dactylosporangium vinaceum]|uniref:WXG100 family type VII secretion target n=1 Tax=Dactylosporangium vinaceum TaxID=53362 RepID=A0ABV5MK23_9ACTN|nr:hypothetical protein [Dactylosporangium vinaceum]UAB92765.1 hypothetical protein Dvina_31100 [Dactylosporangium vinaceum]
MAVMWGADADELDDLGRRMTQAADLLDAVRHEVSAALGRAAWDGDDAADFHGQWNHRLAGLLQTTTNATRDASTRLHRNAAEQRRASGTDSGNPTAPLARPGGGGGDGGWGGDGSGFGPGQAWEWGSLFAGTVMLGVDGLDVFKKIGAVDRFAHRPLVELLTKEHALFGLADDATGLKGVVHAADRLGPLALIGAGVDGYTLGSELARGGDWDRKKTDAAVDVAFDIAEAAAITVPPLALGIGAVHVGFDLYEKLPPNVHHAIEGAVVNAAKDVVNAHVEAVKAEVHLVQDVAKGATHIVSGGVNAAKHFLGFGK